HPLMIKHICGLLNGGTHAIDIDRLCDHRAYDDAAIAEDLHTADGEQFSLVLYELMQCGRGYGELATHVLECISLLGMFVSPEGDVSYGLLVSYLTVTRAFDNQPRDPAIALGSVLQRLKDLSLIEGWNVAAIWLHPLTLATIRRLLKVDSYIRVIAGIAGT